MSNYKFYAKSLAQLSQGTQGTQDSLSEYNRTLLKSVGQTLLADSFPEFVGSTPSIVLHNGELVVVQRFVNYRINDTGGYVNRANISTKNVVAVFDIETSPDKWVKTREFEMDYNRSLDSLYVGLEDVRILSHDGRLVYNANRGINLHHLMVEHGAINLDTEKTRSGLVLIENQKQIEKNWVLFEDAAGVLKIVYGWNDLVIGDLKEESELPESDNESSVDSDDEPTARGDQATGDQATGDDDTTSFLFAKTHTIPTPPFFKHIRGSTNGIRIDDEIWFMCHVVSYEDRRYYYHLFVVLDSSTYAVKKYTTMFSLVKEKVEYTLGFVYNESRDEFLIGYSKMDRETDYLTIPKSSVEKLCLLG